MAIDTRIDLGNDVPAVCTHPECNVIVHRGLVHLCGTDPAGAGQGCGLHFCGAHLSGPEQTCDRCANGDPPYDPKVDTPDFPEWRMTGQGWKEWREAHPELVARTYEKYVAKMTSQEEQP